MKYDDPKKKLNKVFTPSLKIFPFAPNVLIWFSASEPLNCEVSLNQMIIIDIRIILLIQVCIDCKKNHMNDLPFSSISNPYRVSTWYGKNPGSVFKSPPRMIRSGAEGPFTSSKELTEDVWRIQSIVSNACNVLSTKNISSLLPSLLTK